MRRRLRRGLEPQELNITAFMNLMVVLVPFLLMMVVFSRVTILELNLPRDGAPADTDKPALQLEVVLRQDRLELANHGALIRTIPNVDGRYDLATLAQALQEIKAGAPETTAATLLLEPQIKYDHLVGVMDTVRVVAETSGGETRKRELFPDISIGDAPRARGGS